MKNKALNRYRESALLGVLLTSYLIFVSLQLNQTPGHWLNRLDMLLYDVRFNLSLEYFPKQTGDQPIAILDIDEQSLAEQGRWPWSRHKLAELVNILSQYGAVVVAFDVVFSEPERNPVDEVRNRIAVDGEVWQVPDGWYRQVDADNQFAQDLPSMDSVLGFFFLDEESVKVGQLPEPVYAIEEDQQDHLLSITKAGYAANLPILQGAAQSGGFVTTFADADGAIRRSPLVIRHGEHLYPSLSLATLMTYLFDRQLQLQTAPLGEVDAIRFVGIADQMFRTDGVGRVIVPFRGGKKTFPYYSATDVMNGRIDNDALEGAIVLVGTSAIGLADLRATPVGTQYPGVEVHANILDAMLTDGFPYRPEWQAGATLLQLVLVGALLSLWLPRLGPVAAMLVSGFTALIVISGNFYLWARLSLDLPIASILLLVAALTMLNLGYGFLRETNNRRLLKGMFDQYVPPAHIDQMMGDPEAYQFAGEQKEMTVLFSDIRSFTNISENLSATDLKMFLNGYFTPITKVIFDNEGTIDKYVGDMVMAFWGAPLDDERHAYHAIKAALDMQATTQQLKQEFHEKGWPEVNIGIGINTGPMNVGDMGSSYRRAYTVLGDSVNLGSRLESITKFYGAAILVGEGTQQLAPEFLYRYVDRIQVKGKNEPIRVYEPLCLQDDATAEQLDEQRLYESAQAHYFAQQWSEAITSFERLTEAYPEQKLYEVYLERIEGLKEEALPEDWDGVFRHTQK